MNFIRAFTPCLCVCLLTLAAPPRLDAEEAELVTDRPDQTESAEIVPTGSVQIEVGATWTEDDEGPVEIETFAVPQTLVRIGLAERFELRLGWGGREDSELRLGSTKLDSDGAADGELGAKILLREERGGAPQTAILVSTSVPIGSSALSSDRWDPAFRLSFAHTLSDRLSLGYNAGLSWSSEEGLDGRRHTLSNYLYTAALGIGLSERWGAFVELFGETPASAEGQSTLSLDAGLTYLLRPNLQLDLAAGSGLSGPAPDLFVGLGVTLRVPR